MTLKLKLNSYRYLHLGLRCRDPSVAESIRIATCDIWPLFVQHHSLVGNQSTAAANGEATAIGKGKNAVGRSLEELSLALQNLGIWDAQYIVVPQHNPS